jgi:hypothetical protein
MLKLGDKWREKDFKGDFQAGRVNLDAFYNAIDHAAAYAVCWLYAPQDIPNAKILVGSDDYIKVWVNGKLVHEDKRMTFPPFEMMAAALNAEGNIWAGYRKDRTKWFPAELKDKHGPSRKSKNVYFGGCTVSYVENDIGQAAEEASSSTAPRVFRSPVLSPLYQAGEPNREACAFLQGAEGRRVDGGQGA